MAQGDGRAADRFRFRHVGVSGLSRALERVAVLTTNWVGSSWAFIVALLLTITWLVSGPIFHYSDTWQLVMNTVSSIVTFLMVFLLQRSQNKESLAMQVKLNELLAAVRGASNRLINIENLSEDEVRDLHERYTKLIERSGRGNRGAPCSIEDAVRQHEGAGQDAAPAP